MQTGIRVRLWTVIVAVGLGIGSGARAASIAYTYDDAGRLVSAAYDTGIVISYTYDSAGNLLQRVVDTGAPAVENVSADVPDGTYGQNQTIMIELEFSEVVFVTGNPTLTLAAAATPPLAVYADGSGTTVLRFRYVVGEAEAAADLDVVNANALSVAGGSIQDAQGTDADLTLPVPGSAGSLSANRALVIDPTAWQFVLQVTNAQTPDLVLGMNPGASNGQDPGFDAEAGIPTAGGGYAAVRDPNALLPDLKADVRAVAETGVWPLRVSAPATRAAAVISWDPATVPGNVMSLVEVDAAGVPIQGGLNANMAVTDSVSVAAGTTVYFDLHFNQYLFVLQLGLGWNLCALPIEPHDSSIAAVLAGHESGDVLVWNASLADYEVATNIHPKQGFWVYYLGPDATLRLPVLGGPAADTTTSLSAGWWLVGGTGPPPYDSLSLPLDVTPAGAADDRVWIWMSDHYGTPNAFDNGKGGWIFVDDACEVELAE